MVYTRCVSLIPVAASLVAMQLHHTSASSIYYDPVTVSGTTDKISDKFPAYGGDVADQDCVIAKKEDPTLPNITTIPCVPVEFPHLLANASVAPIEPVFTKVGTVILAEAFPNAEDYQDAYINTATGTEVHKKAGRNCATGWEEPQVTRNLETEPERRLEATTNYDIAKLEAFFKTKMVMTFKDLPTVGVTVTSPWAGPFWPNHQDSINIQWDEDQPSAAEKYAMAFGKDVQTFMDKVSKKNGIDSQPQRKVCTSQDDCSTLDDGSSCSIRTNQTSGHCIPMWFGICHAWTPAAILESEPNCPVTHNGVTFKAMDIKALITLVYDGARVKTIFTGGRFNGGFDTSDSYGRHSNNAYRDVNPALFHIVNANLLGKLNATYIVDVEANAEVWNQPVRGFKVFEQTKMTPQKAAKTFYGLDQYPWNAAAKSIVYVKTRLSWISETYTDGGLVQSGQINNFTTGKYYHYLLELDAAGEIIGGEWVYESHKDHPDFMWLPLAKPDASTVTSVGLSYADVSMLLQKSVACSA